MSRTDPNEVARWYGRSDHRAQRIGNGEYPAPDRNLLVLQAAWIAAVELVGAVGRWPSESAV